MKWGHGCGGFDEVFETFRKYTISSFVKYQFSWFLPYCCLLTGLALLSGRPEELIVMDVKHNEPLSMFLGMMKLFRRQTIEIYSIVFSGPGSAICSG